MAADTLWRLTPLGVRVVRLRLRAVVEASKEVTRATD